MCTTLEPVKGARLFTDLYRERLDRLHAGTSRARPAVLITAFSTASMPAFHHPARCCSTRMKYKLGVTKPNYCLGWSYTSSFGYMELPHV